MTLISETSFELLDQLEKNNSKEWHDAHKSDIKTHCVTPFGEMLEHVSNRLIDSDRPLEGSAKTMFRMNRDVRFAKDKRPYNPCVSGVLTPSGTKNETAGLVYVQMNAQGGWASGGFYKLPTAKLGQIRQRIIGKTAVFQGVLGQLSSQGLTLDDADQLTRMPKGFTEFDDHPNAAHIKLKSFIVHREISQDAWINGDVTGIIADLAKQASPLIEFGNAALATSA